MPIHDGAGLPTHPRRCRPTSAPASPRSRRSSAASPPAPGPGRQPRRHGGGGCGRAHRVDQRRRLAHVRLPRAGAARPGFDMLVPGAFAEAEGSSRPSASSRPPPRRHRALDRAALEPPRRLTIVRPDELHLPRRDPRYFRAQAHRAGAAPRQGGRRGRRQRQRASSLANMQATRSARRCAACSAAIEDAAGHAAVGPPARYLDTMRTSASILLGVIDDSRLLAKEAGQAAHRVDLTSTCASIVEDVTAMLPARQEAWSFAPIIAPEVPRTCAATRSGCARCWQPGRQRDQVHRARRSGGGQRRAGGRSAAAAGGARHRHRHRVGQAGAHLRSLHPGRQLDQPALRRHRLGPDHRAPAGRADEGAIGLEQPRRGPGAPSGSRCRCAALQTRAARSNGSRAARARASAASRIRWSTTTPPTGSSCTATSPPSSQSGSASSGEEAGLAKQDMAAGRPPGRAAGPEHARWTAAAWCAPSRPIPLLAPMPLHAEFVDPGSAGLELACGRHLAGQTGAPVRPAWRDRHRAAAPAAARAERPAREPNRCSSPCSGCCCRGQRDHPEVARRCRAKARPGGRPGRGRAQGGRGHHHRGLGHRADGHPDAGMDGRTPPGGAPVGAAAGPATAADHRADRARASRPTATSAWPPAWTTMWSNLQRRHAGGGDRAGCSRRPAARAWRRRPAGRGRKAELDAGRLAEVRAR